MLQPSSSRAGSLATAACTEADVAQVTMELEKLESEYAGAEISPANLTWVQLAKTIAEIRAMTLALKMTSTPAIL